MNVYEVGPFRLNADRLTLTHSGRAVSLGPKVVETLLVLVEAAGSTVTKEALMDRVWPEGFVEEANLAQNIYVLRKTFRSYGSPGLIETVPREGYRFTGEMRRIADAAAAGFRHRVDKATVVASVVFALTALIFLLGYDSERHAPVPGHLSATGARFYEIGRYYWNLRTIDGVEKSIGYFAAVVDSDPNNARGYAALADANVTMGDYCYGTHRPSVYFARAQAYARKALALDPHSSQAHAALGFLALHRHNASGAMAELRRAIRLDPAYAPAHEWIAIALLREGNRSEGLHQLEVASALDPLSVSTQAWLASVAYADGRFSDAILYSRQALELAPKRPDALTTIGEAYEARGDVARAIEAFKRYGEYDPYARAQAAALLAQAYALAGRMPQARAELAYARAHADAIAHLSWVAIENGARFNTIHSNG